MAPIWFWFTNGTIHPWWRDRQPSSRDRRLHAAVPRHSPPVGQQILTRCPDMICPATMACSRSETSVADVYRRNGMGPPRLGLA